MEVQVGALDTYGVSQHFRSVLPSFVAKNNICCQLKIWTSKMPFSGQDGPGCAKWPKMGFGARFCVESVKMRIFNLKIVTFVSNTSTLHSTGTQKWVPRAIFDEKCPKSPKIDFFENRSGTPKVTYGVEIWRKLLFGA